MMLILSDCPDAFPWPGLAPGAWASRDLPALAGADAEVWRALAGDAPPWTAEVLSPGPDAFWSRLFVVREAPASQFDALRAALAGELALPGPVAAVALDGRGFHGHRGRAWAAARGNLHLCAAIAPDGLAARDALALVALPAVAVVAALRSPALGGLPAGIKWVNDILLDGRKVAGVLTASQSLDERVTLALFGVGLNVGVAPAVAPTPFVPAVTSLAEHGAVPGVPAACAAVMGALAAAWRVLRDDGAPAVVAAYRAASVVVGRRVAVWDEPADPGAAAGPSGAGVVPAVPADPAAPLAAGVVAGIGDDLALQLCGRADPLSRGRLAFLD